MDLPQDDQVSQGIGGVSKERLVAEKPEAVVPQEYLKTPEIPPEIEHVEAIAGAELTLTQPVTDYSTGQPILDNTVPQQTTVTLPLTETEMNQALHIKIIYSLRWLAELMKRLIKIVGGKFIYKYKLTEWIRLIYSLTY